MLIQLLLPSFFVQLPHFLFKLGFWGCFFGFGDGVFFVSLGSFWQEAYFCASFLALCLGLSFPSAKLVPVPGLLSPYFPLICLLLLFLAWESG